MIMSWLMQAFIISRELPVLFQKVVICIHIIVLQFLAFVVLIVYLLVLFMESLMFCYSGCTWAILIFFFFSDIKIACNCFSAF